MIGGGNLDIEFPNELSRCSHHQRVPRRKLAQRYETKTEPCPPKKSMKSWLTARLERIVSLGRRCLLAPSGMPIALSTAYIALWHKAAVVTSSLELQTRSRCLPILLECSYERFHMPWTANDAERHTHKATTTELKELWAKVANESLERNNDEGRAVREANAVVARQEQSR